MALVLVDSYEVTALIMCLSSLFDEDSVCDESFKTFPTLKISGFRGMRTLSFSGKHRYCYLLRNSFSRSKIFSALLSLTLENNNLNSIKQ